MSATASWRWFTADQHFGHRNIIDSWDDVVADDDTVWVLGDFALGSIVDTLPLAGALRGHVILLTGNHDRCWPGHGRRATGWTERYLDTGFSEVRHGTATISIGDTEVRLCHFPYRGNSHDHDRRLPLGLPAVSLGRSGRLALGGRRALSGLCVAAVIAGCVGAFAPAAFAGESTADAPPPQVPLLGVMSAASGRYQSGTLTLEGVQPSAVWFSDRPTRDAGTMGIKSFLELFFRGDDPPNAALAIAGANESRDVAIVELSDPVYRSSKKRLTFTAELIPDVAPDRLAAHPRLAAYVVRNDGRLPKRFSTNALLVDSAAVGSSRGTNVLPPPLASLPASDVSALASRVAADQAALEDVLEKIRVSIQQNLGPCMFDLEDKVNSIFNNLLTQVAPVLQTMQSDLAQNGGAWLPPEDTPEYDTAVANLESIEVEIREATQLYGAYTAPDPLPCNNNQSSS